jgi:hypothetical protein
VESVLKWNPTFLALLCSTAHVQQSHSHRRR